LDQVVEFHLGALRSRKRSLGGRREARHVEPPGSGVATNDHDPVHEHARMAPAAMGKEGAVQLDAGAAEPTRSWYDAHAGNAGQEVGDPLWSAGLDLLPGDEMAEIRSLPFVKADTGEEGVRWRGRARDLEGREGDGEPAVVAGFAPLVRSATVFSKK